MASFDWYVVALAFLLLPGAKAGSSSGNSTNAAPEVTEAPAEDPAPRALVQQRSVCSPSPCPYGTLCIESYGRSKCVASMCSPNPCQHGGHCTQSGTSVLCSCLTGFTGKFCGTVLRISNVCHPNPCLHNGICHTSGHGYTCTCVSRYFGIHCEGIRHIADNCHPNPCLNGGRCTSRLNSYYCDCVAPYHGTRCESGQRFIDPCYHNPCLHGVCSVVGGTYSCSCYDGYYGSRCESQITRGFCLPNPCLNGGRCAPQGNSYDCVCTPPFRGSHCEISDGIPGNQCSGGFNPCHNMCECVTSCRHASGYYCRSNNGYLGKNCTVPPPVIQCQPNQVIVTVDDAFIREYDLGIRNSRLHMAHTARDLAAQDCFATTTSGISHTFTVPLPFTKCGTVVETRGGKTVVTNNIWLNRATSGGYDMPVPVICFECTYEKEYVIVTSLQPAIDQPPILRETGVERVQGVIELCKVSSSCPLPCPPLYSVSQGAVYTVGEMIHLNIRGDGSQGFSSQTILALKTLYLSCEGSPGSSAVVQLVTNRCPGGAQNYMQTTITHSGQSSSICVSFQVPRLRGCTSFYIHAEVDNCGVSGCNFNQAGCLGQSVSSFGRRRRSSRADDLNDNGFSDVFGPIYFLRGSYGVPKEIMFPNASIVDTPAVIDDLFKNNQNVVGDRSHMIIGLTLLCLSFILGAAIVAIICSRKFFFSRK